MTFRYRDGEHHYRFAMDQANGYRRLIRADGGGVAVLWDDAVAYQTGREYLFTVDCVGGLLRGFLDGVPLFEVLDSAHPSGRIGLYCSGNQDARFHEVRVGAPVWAHDYTFAEEGLLPAGSRYRVRAGNAVHGASAPEVGVRERHAAALADRGRPVLFPHQSTLGIRSLLAVPGHSRAFVDAGEYGAVPILVLRKADGTGFALFAAAGGAFGPGEYRLALAYLRDNRAADPTSLILREAGRSDPEQVAIDVPWSSLP